MDSTTALFARYRRHGDLIALGRVFDQLAPRLLGLAMHVCGNAADAEDALQATFVVAMQKAAVFDGRQEVAPWLAGILAGEAKNLARRQQRRRTQPIGEVVAADGDPQAVSERGELVAALRTHIEALPAEQRQVLLLQLQHGLQPAEIAEALGVPPGTVRMRLHRGIAALRTLLPASLVGAVMAMLPSRGLAAVRDAVLAHAAGAGAGAVAGGGAVLLWGGLMMKTCVVAVLAAVALLAWWGWSGPLEPAVDGRLGAASVAPAVVVGGSTGPSRDADSTADLPAPVRTTVAMLPGSLRVSVRADRVARTGRHESVADGSAGSGAPVPDVLVEIWHGAQAPDEVDAHLVTARTDGDGCCTFSELAAVEWSVALTIAGVHVGPLRRVVVPPGAQADCELHLPLARELHGRVVDGRGMPVAGAAVFAGRAAETYGQRTWSPRRVGTSGPDGTFHCGVVAGELLLAARKAGFAGSWSHPVEQAGDGPVVLQLADEPGAIEVKVTHPDGRAIHGAIVQVQGLGPWRRLAVGELVAPPLGVVADEVAPGTLVATDLPAGGYSICVMAPGRVAHAQLQVTAAATSSMRVTFEAGVEVRGRVRGEHGAPLCGLVVEITRPGSDRNQVVRTDGQGAFCFAGIAPGVVSVTAVRLGTQARATKSITVPPDRGVECDLELADAAAIRGRVVDESGAGLPGHVVSAEQGARAHSAFTDHDGAFALFGLDATAATFRVRGRRSGDEVACREVAVAQPGTPVTIVVPAAALPHAVLRGRIRRADGQPPVESEAMLRDEGVGTSAAADGSFHFEGLAAGDVTLVLVAAGCVARTMRVQLAHGEQRDLGDLELPPAGELRVRFRRPDGQPWREWPPAPRLVPFGERDAAVVEGVGSTVRDGVVMLTGIPGGRYTVCGPAADDLLVEPCVVDVAAGQTTDVELPTLVGRQLTFRVEDFASIASCARATVVVRRQDGSELARGEIAPAKQVLDVRLLVPLGDAVAEVVADGLVTHRSPVVVGLLLTDAGTRTLTPLAADDR